MKLIETAALSALAVFTPIKTVILTTLVLVMVDLITGVLAARKRKEPITSAGFKQTVGKIFMYEIAICMAFLAQQNLIGDLLPVCKLVSALIGMTELKSVLENLDAVSGDGFFKGVIARMIQSKVEGGGNKK